MCFSWGGPKFAPDVLVSRIALHSLSLSCIIYLLSPLMDDPLFFLLLEVKHFLSNLFGRTIIQDKSRFYL